ncbi:hypothetical protein BCR37DRAFT_379056 [Protomyces lactucae-debilis]|uniref:Uncharacterized protein n=1 Tax=Protomyces lactucae-debilis TaxID=2754530 RepID=A0A1Y2FGP7_PROLT|nr:uncharacterized protein BCR37DRAFT_379056 [Protomyces lactucae-debilis]ORY83099.1 hypothetical protein BCR37DRAFT_379056 [Protomyces lactucae-debilis]
MRCRRGRCSHSPESPVLVVSGVKHNRLAFACVALLRMLACYCSTGSVWLVSWERLPMFKLSELLPFCPFASRTARSLGSRC